MHDGLWTVSFRSSTGAHGTGVAVLHNGKVHGGDAQYVYVGTYKSAKGPTVGSDMEAELTITRFNQAPGTVSVFGPAQQFELVLKGKSAPASILLTGHVKGQANLTISMDLKKHAEI